MSVFSKWWFYVGLALLVWFVVSIVNAPTVGPYSQETEAQAVAKQIECSISWRTGRPSRVHQQVAEGTITIKNKSNRAVKNVFVTVLFRNENGRIVERVARELNLFMPEGAVVKPNEMSDTDEMNFGNVDSDAKTASVVVESVEIVK